jgi:glucose-1-phosphate adenylyltransferase
MDPFSSRFIEILAVEQKPTKKAWYEGTADAVRQNLEYFIETPVDYFLILSGDQLYHMDYQHMVRMAQATNADMVIAALPIDATDAKRMGVLRVGEDDAVTDFYEKPQDKAILDRFLAPRSVLNRAEVDEDSERKYLGSMGIYLFKREALLNMLEHDIRDDFGKCMKGESTRISITGIGKTSGRSSPFTKPISP